MTETPERHSFQAEISRLLHLMVHSVYSEKDVFLRELISNASDACDKLRYAAVTDPALTADDPAFAIRVTADKDARTITIADSGLGMDRQDLIDNLGTIAKSGTDAFMAAFAEAQKAGDEGQSLSLIGKFGVGFYSAFMVAERVRVVSVKAGTQAAHAWESDGLGEFTVSETDAAEGLIAARGTAITLHLRDGEDGYLEAEQLKRVIQTYSNHISFPITIVAGDDEADAAPVNAGTALWVKPKSEITDEQYTEFYRHVGHAFDEPWLTVHYRAEGRHEYAVLVFVPTARPFDLYDAERKGRVKLYVNRVFITGEAPLLPGYLRFVRGVIDSSDVPLTVSREMLQNNPLVRSIGGAVTNRVLSELTKVAEKEPERYAAFWDVFGPVLKEGLYEDMERRDTLLGLARFRTTTSGEGVRSLKEYVADLKDNQTAIYYVTGETTQAVETSPHLEGYRSKGIEVLLLSDPVDAFWVSSVEGFEGKPLKSVTRGASDLSAIDDGDDAQDETKAEDRPSEPALGMLIAAFKQALGDTVKDVRSSDRLTTSAVCLVADDSGLDMHIEKILKAQNLGQELPASRVLEINPTHALVKALADKAQNGVTPDVEDAARLLFDQARIQQGESVEDPAAFAQRLQAMLVRAV